MEKNIKDYLPFYLGCWVMDNEGKIYTLIGIEHGAICHSRLTGRIILAFSKVKLVLRPLSDMREEEKIGLLSNMGEPQMYGDGEFIISPVGYLIIKFKSYSNAYGFTPEAIKFLLSKHFDPFGLIEAGLAIDKTTLTHK